MTLENRVGPQNTLQGRNVQAVCRLCERNTTHSVLTSAEFEAEVGTTQFSVTSWDDYQVIECQGCHSLGFRHVNRNTENFDVDPETEQDYLVEEIKLYPEETSGRPPMRNAELLPPQVLRVYRETLEALGRELPVLAGIGIRALVETICNDRTAKGYTLEKKIDDLATQGLIAVEGAEILHSLRIMGNEAAHQVKPHRGDDLQTAMDVIEHALQGGYVLPKQAALLPKRKK